MSLVRVAEIGEMTCDLDIAADVVVAVVITHARRTPPVFVLYDAARVQTARVVGLDRASSTTALTPVPLTRGDITHQKFATRLNALLLPSFVFYERAEE